MSYYNISNISNNQYLLEMSYNYGISRDPNFRVEFITKTITCLFLQFLFTFSCITLCVFNESLYVFILNNIVRLIWTGMIGTLITIYYMLYFASVKTAIHLAIFTLFETLLLCTISVLYGHDTTLISMLVTIGVTAGLGVYALTTKIDHSGWFSLFSSGVTCVLVIGLVNLFIKSPMLHMAELYIGTVVFLGYIVLDIQFFLNNNTNTYIMNHISKYGTKDLHIIASLNIYLNIINLYVRILDIVKMFKGGKIRNKNRNL